MGDRTRAIRAYTIGYMVIVVVSAVSFLLLGAIYLSALAGTLIAMIMLGIAAACVNFSFTMVDASFRAVDRYARGTTILTGFRLAEFIVSFSAAALTRSVEAALLLLLAYKVAVALLLFWVSGRPNNAMRPDPRLVTVQDLLRTVHLARGQLLLSLYTAVSVMGPQLVVSAVFPPTVAVLFNTHRTYMRLAAALVNIVNASAWPVLTALFAERNGLAIARFTRRHAGFGTMFAAMAVLALWAASGPVFSALFGDRIALDPTALALIGLAVLLSCATTMQQTMSLASNIPSHAAAIGTVTFVLCLALLPSVGHLAGFHWSLVILVLIEAIVLVATSAGSRRHWRGLSPSVQP